MQLARRLDRLEFELRKSLHELRLKRPQAAPNQPPGGQQDDNELAGSTGGPTDDADQHQQHQQQLRWTDLAERLELVEKFITSSTTKVSTTWLD